MALTCLLTAHAATAMGQDVGHVAILHHNGSDYSPFSGGIPNLEPRAAAAKSFYSAHRDAYDFLIVFPAFDYDTSATQGETLGLHSMVRNGITGIGIPESEPSLDFGSYYRLKGYIDVNSLVPGINDRSFDSALGVIAHEVAHQWSGKASFVDPATGSTSLALLGRDQAHWSFFLDSNASVLYGSRWQPSGTGSFTAVESLKRYSPLDLYLMGVFAPSEVPAFSLIRPAPGTTHAAVDLPPSDGTVIQGTAQTITLDQIIQALGARSPTVSSAQAVFRAGFALLLGPGQVATPEQLAFVDSLRREWANRFFFMTQGRAVMETELVEAPPTVVASNPSVQLGLNYLLGVQHTDGSWSDSGPTTVRETQVALEALALLRSDTRVPASMAQGASFLAAIQATDADTSARGHLGLLAAQPDLMPISGAQHDLVFANPNGGIGLVGGYQSTVIDTVLAALAGLRGPPELVTAAVDFLEQTQNSDGGWPWFSGGASDLTITGLVLELFSRIDRSVMLMTSVNSALAYVATHNGADGHYRNDLTGGQETAAAVLALDAWDQLWGVNAQQTTQALLDLQQPDGSWSDSVYQTAMALKALRRLVVPNLSVSAADVAVSAASVTEGEPVQARIVVHNTGHADASQVEVRAYDSNGQPFGPTAVAPLVQAGAATVVNLTLDTVGHAGSTQLFVVVDPDGTIDEIRRDDNRTAVGLNVTSRPQQPDLFVARGSLVASPSSISRVGTTVTVTARVGNLGRTDVAGASVSLLSGGTLIAETTAAFPAASDQTIALTGTLPAGGAAARLTVVVDPQNAIAEAREDNNTEQTVLTVVPTVDLRVAQVLAMPNPVDQGRDLAIQFQVSNRGTTDALPTSATVAILDAVGTVIATLPGVPLTVPSGGTASGQAVWRANSATAAAVRVDASYTGDLDPSDNSGMASFTVNTSGLPNLLVKAQSVSVQPSSPLEGQPATVTATIRNSGNSAAGAFAVDLWIGDPGQGGSRATQAQIASLAANTETAVSLPFTLSSANEATLVVVIDSDNQVAEFDENDNTAVLTVQSISRPDIAIADGDIQPQTLFPQAGDQVPVKVTVRNLGRQDVGSFTVQLFQGAPETGGMLLGTSTIPSLAGQGSADVDFVWSATGLTGTVTLVAIANPDHTAAEARYDNNRGQCSVSIQAGVLALSEPYFSPNGDGAKDKTELFYRLQTPSAVQVSITDRRERVVRTLSDSSNSAVEGSLTWDGRNDSGAVVRDGVYRLAVSTSDQEVVGTIDAVVDTNRTTVLDAPSELLVPGLLEDAVRRVLNPGALTYRLVPAGSTPDESAVVFHYSSWRIVSWNSYVQDCGFFSMPVDGGDPVRLSPIGWSNSSDCRVWAARLMPDGRSVVYLPSDGGPAIRRFDIATQTATTLVDQGGVYSLVPSSNGMTVLFLTAAGWEEIGLDGTGRHVISPMTSDAISPDGAQVLFGAQEPGGWGLHLASLSGAGERTLVVPKPPQPCLEWRYTCIDCTNECLRYDPTPIPTPPGAVVLADGVGLGDVVWVSPDEIAYSANGLWLLDLKSGTTEQLVSVDVVQFPQQLAVDPAGEHISFADTWGGTSTWDVLASGSTPRVFYDWTHAGVSSLGGAVNSPVPSFSQEGTFLYAAVTPFVIPAQEQNSQNSYFQSVYHLGNLSTRLMAYRRPSSTSLVFRGTAVDINFESWELSARPRASRDEPVVIARGTVPAIDDELAQWTPPEAGTWEAILTARDKAGNVKSVSTLASWAEVPAIANVRVAPEYFSPNGDGHQDAAVVSYTVQDPISVQFTVRSATGANMRSLPVTHTQTGSFSQPWDGRDDAGVVTTDGVYTLALGEQETHAVLDNTPPVATLRLGDGQPGSEFQPLYYPYDVDPPRDDYPASWDCGPQIPPTSFQKAVYHLSDPRYVHGTVPFLALNMTWKVSDEHLSEWAFEAASEAGPANFSPFDKEIYNVTSERSGAFPVIDIPGDRVRLRARDAAANEVATPTYAIPEVAIVKGFGPGLLASPCQRLLAPMVFPTAILSNGSNPFVSNVIPGIPLPNAPKLPLMVTWFKYSIEPGGKQVGFCFDAAFHGFLVEHTIRERIVSASIAYRRPYETDLVVDQNNVRLTPHGLVTWDARTVPEDITYAEVRLLDARGRTFAAPIPGGKCDPKLGGWPTTLCSQTPGGEPFQVAGIDPVLLDHTRKSLPNSTLFYLRDQETNERINIPFEWITQVESSAEVDSSADVPPRKYLFRIDPKQLPGCTYSVFGEGIGGAGDPEDLSLGIAIAAFNVCGLRAAHLEIQGDRATVSLSETYRKAISYIDLFLKSDGPATWVATLSEFESSSPPVGISLADMPMDTPLALSANVHFADGTATNGVAVLGPLQTPTGSETSGETQSCPGPFSLRRPSLLATVSVSRDITPVCAGLPADYRLTVNATDQQADVTSLQLGVSLASSAPLALSTAPFSPAQQVSTSATMYSADYAEGTWSAQATATDALGRSVVSEPASVAINRSAPYLALNAPAAGATVCPVEERGPDGRSRRMIRVEGEIVDPTLEEYSFLLRCGTETQFASVPRSSGGGSLGEFDVSSRRSSDCELRLEARNSGGGSYCTAPTPFHLVNGASVSTTVEPVLFSPNGDGLLDFTQLTLKLDEPSAMTVTATDMAGRSGVVWSGDLSSGQSTVPWDGAIQGIVAADGNVTLKVDAVDPCSNTATTNATVRIDNTPPLVRIDSPTAGARIGGLALVSGEASDTNFDHYELAIGVGLSPVSYQLVFSSDTPETGFLGAVPTSGLASGIYTIRLWARDQAGNEATTTTTIEVAPKQIINLFSVSPALISPNSDGVLDTSVAQYQLLGAATVTLDIIDATDAVVATILPSSPTLAGDGQAPITTAILAGVVDGDYRARIRATAASLEETETAPLALDRVAPNIVVQSPTSGAVIAGNADVTGSIQDVHLTSWSAKLALGTEAPVTAASGKATLSGVLASLRNLAEGDYRLLLDAADGAGNTAHTELSFASDTTAPTVAFVSPEEGAFVSGAKGPVDVRGDVQDLHLANVKLEVTSGGGSAHEVFSGSAIGTDGLVTHWDVQAEPDGPAQLRLVAVDAAGNQADALRSVTVDNTPPVARIDAPRDTYLRAGDSFVGVATDTNLTTWTLELASGPSSVAALWVPVATGSTEVSGGALAMLASVPADGIYSLRLTVVDRAGNTSQDTSSFIVDNTPPRPPTSLVANAQGRDVVLIWGASPDSDVVGYQVFRAVEATGFAPIGSQVNGLTSTDPGLADGTYRYVVVAVDGAGLQSEYSPEASVTIDLTPPRVAIQKPVSGATVSGRFQVLGTAWSADDFKEYRLYLGSGSAPGSFTLITRSGIPVASGVLGQIDVGALPDKSQQTIRLEAEDLAGNLAEARVTVVVDSTPPAAPVLVSATPSSSSVTVTWQPNVEDDLAGYILYRNGSIANAPMGVPISDLTAYLLTASAVTYVDTSLGDGTYTYELQAFDRAGNGSGLSNSLTATVETHAPHAVITTPAPLARLGQPTTVVAETADEDVASVQFLVKDGGAASFQPLGTPATCVPYAATLDPAAFSSPVLELRAVATDRSGNSDPNPTSIFVFYAAVPMAPVPSARVTEDTVDLSWTDPNPPASVSGYDVARDGSSILAAPPVPTGTANASDTTTAPGLGADGATWTAWASQKAGTQWWQLDLSQPVVAREVDLSLYLTSQIEVSVNVRGVWVTAHQGQDSGTVAISLDPGLEISGVRVKFLTAPSGSVGLYEATVLPLPLAPAPPLQDGPVSLGMHSYQVAAVTPFGLEAEDSTSANIYAPALSAPPEVVSTSPLPLTGSGAAASSTVNILSAGTVAAQATAEADGTFAAEVPLADGLNVFTAQATDTLGNVSLPSSPVSVTYDAPPAAQITLSLTSVSGSDVALAFTVDGDTSRIAGFRLNRVGAGAPVVTSTLGAADRSVVDSGVANGTYTYAVVAFNSHGLEGTPSNSVNATVSVDLFSAPNGLIVRALPSGGALQLNWSYIGPPAYGFLVERAASDSGPFAAINTAGLVMELIYIDRGLTNGTPYYYRVRAVDDVGNASAPSEVAFGIPMDTLAPEQPRITSPTTPDNAITVTARTTEVSGLSEPGVSVELRQNGLWYGVAQAGPLELVSEAANPSQGSAGFGVSLDGRTLAIGNASAGQEWLDVSGPNTSLSIQDPSISGFGRVVFSPDGSQIAFEAISQQDGQGHVWIASTATGSFQRLTQSNGSEWAPVWSASGSTLAYAAERAGYTSTVIGVFDVAVGTENILSRPDVNLASPGWLSSGALLAIAEPSGPGAASSVVQFAIAGGTGSDLYTSNATLSDLVVSPRSDFAAAVIADSTQDILLLEMSSGGAAIRLASDEEFDGLPVFAKDGRELVWLHETSLLSVNLASLATQELGAAGSPDRLVGTAHGLFTNSASDGAIRYDWGGRFKFTGVLLADGDNQFVATAENAAGNRSQPSEPIWVYFDPINLADLSVEAVVQPAIPVAGQSANALVTVRNVGGADSIETSLQVTVLTSDGSLRPAAPVAIGVLPPDGSTLAAVTLDLAGLTGTQRLLVVVDPAGRVSDADRSNNQTTVTFQIVPSAAIQVSVAASPSVVSVNGTVTAAVTLLNPGLPRDIIVRTRIADGSGATVVAAPEASYTPLPGGTSTTFSRSLPVGSTLTGAYQVVAEAVADGTIIASGSTPITITPDYAVDLSLVSLRSSYLIGEEVTLQGTVTNRSLNSSLQGATYHLELLDGTGATAYAAPVRALPSLWLGGSSVQETIVPWQALAAGSYQARATVELDGTVLAQAITPVVVFGRPLLSGTVSVVGDTRTPPAVTAGSDVQLAFTIENQGTSDSQGIAAWVVVVDPDTLAIIANQTIPLTGLAAGTQYSGTAFISTAGLPLKVYGVSLVADHDGQANDLLATTRFRVADPAPPVLALQNLVSGMFVRGSVTPLVRATDDYSGTAAVRVSVDGQSPAALALASGVALDGIWSGSVTLGVDGLHTLVFSAADAEGNDGLTTPTSANPVTVQLVSDTVPPVVAVSGVNEGVCYAAAATPVATASDLNLAAVDTRLNGTPFVSGTPVTADGDYTLSVQATDRAGNQAATMAHFVVDQTAPKIYLSGASEGAYIANDVQYTVAVVDAHLTALDVTVNGVASSPSGTLSAEGAYTVTAHAADCAGNLSDATLHFFIDKTPPQLTLSGVIDGAYYRIEVTPSWTASDANLASVVGTLNGAPFASGSTITAEGNYLLDVVALDLAGNRTERSAAFIVDRTPPEVTLSGFVEGSYVNADVTPAYSVSDADLDHVEATLDALPFVPGMVASSEGFHVFTVKAFDRAGNETDRTGTFTIDKTPPEVSISGVADGAHVNVPVTLTFTATDTNLASVTATLNGTSFTSGTTVSAEGNYLLVVVALDKAGNRTEKSVAFVIDNGAPVVNLLGFTDGSYVNTDVYPDYTATDSDLDQVIATLDSLPFVRGMVVTADGLHVLQVVATDKAGNRTDRSGSFFIDKTPPVVTLSGFIDGSYVNTNVTPAYSATDTNLDTVQATLNGQPFQSGTVVSAEGSCRLVVVATDKAGNRTEQAGTFSIDKTGPTITISGVTDGLLTKENVTPVVTVTDTNLESSSLTLDGQPFVSGTVVTAEGEHHLVVQATDKAGNSANRSLTFTIDRTAPVITITGVSDGAQYSAAVVPVVTITDDHLTTTVVTLNGAPFVSGTAVAQDGSYTLYARGEDGAGNVAEQTVTFTIQAGQFQLDKRLAGRFARTLALVRGGWCHEGEHGHGRVKELLEKYLGGSQRLLRVTGHEERFLAEMRSGLYNVMLVLDLDGEGHGDDDHGEDHDHDGHCHQHCHHDGECHNHEHRDGHHQEDCHEDHDHHGSGPCQACHDWDGDDHRDHDGWHGEEPYWAGEKIEKLIARELTELVYAGKAGAIVVRTHPADAPELRELLGADLYGTTHQKTVRFSAEPLAPLADLTLEGEATQLKLYTASAVGLYVSPSGGHKCGHDQTEVAVAKQELGLGRSLLFGFDLTRAKLETDAGLALQRAAEWVTPADSSSPLAVAGVELALSASDLETELRIEESLETPLQALAAVPLAHIDATRLSLDWTLPAHDPTRLLRYYARLPDQIGTYTTSTEVTAMLPGGPQLLGTYELELAVAETGSGLLEDARSVVALLPRSGHDGQIRRRIERELAEIAVRQVHHRGDIEKNLEDLFDALGSAADLKTVSPAATRLALDELVRYWEARWYVY